MDFFRKICFFFLIAGNCLSSQVGICQSSTINFSFSHDNKTYTANSAEIIFQLVERGEMKEKFPGKVEFEPKENQELWVLINNVKWDEALEAEKSKRTSLVVLRKDIVVPEGLALKSDKNNWRLKTESKSPILIQFRVKGKSAGKIVIPTLISIPLTSNAIAGASIERSIQIGEESPEDIPETITVESPGEQEEVVLTKEDIYWNDFKPGIDTIKFVEGYLKEFPRGKYQKMANRLRRVASPITAKKILVAQNIFEINLENTREPFIDSLYMSRPRLVQPLPEGENLNLPLVVNFNHRGKLWMRIKDKWNKQIDLELDNSFLAVLDSTDQSGAYQLKIDGGLAPFQVEFHKAGTAKVAKRIFGIEDSVLVWNQSQLLNFKLNGSYDVYVADKRKDFEVLAGRVEVRKGFYIPALAWLALSAMVIGFLWYYIKKNYVDNNRTVFDEEV